MISHSNIRVHETIPEYRGEDPNGIYTLENIKNAIEEKMNIYGIPISIEFDEIKSGGLFKSTVERCIVITNSEHTSDYSKYCITVRNQGIMATISTYIYGSSSSELSVNTYNESQQGGLIMRGIGKLFKPNEQKLKEEHDYYTYLNNCIMSILGGK